MISVEALVAFIPVALVVVVVPGPSVLFYIGRALTDGHASALRTVAGNAAGLVVQVAVVAVGLGALLAMASWSLLALKFAGGLYIVWLGVQAWRHRRDLDLTDIADGRSSRTGLQDLRTGFVLGATNPKSLVLFTALLPQFVPQSATAGAQIALLGATFVLIALVSDSVWAVAAARARGWLAGSARRLERVRGAGSAMLVGVGVWTVLHES